MDEIMNTRKARLEKLKKIKVHRRNAKLIGTSLAVSLTAVSLLGQPKGAKACDCVAYYTVKAGDTLYNLAGKYNVSVEQLKNKNGFTSDRLYVGQQIIVPYKDENGQFPHLNSNTNKEIKKKISSTTQIYTVKSGDTLWKLSKTFGITVEKLMKDNKLTNATLIQGQKIVIKKTDKKTEDQTKENKITYKVLPGDSIWKISNKYGVSIEKILKDNHLTSDSLVPGQKLIIYTDKKKPGTKPSNKNNKPNMALSTIYIVKQGDTLWGLAKKFNLSVEKIKKDNNLVSDSLRVGQKLSIKKAITNTLKKSDMMYTVQPGDTLYTIANRFNINLNQLMVQNQLNDYYVLIGQKLFIDSKNAVKNYGKIIGITDSSSIEVLINGKYVTLEVAYGSSQTYIKWKNKNAFFVYTNTSKSKRAALINLKIN